MTFQLLQHTSISLYADDTTLMTNTNLHIHEFDNIDVLTQTINTELVHINEWLKVNKLSLNAAKSKYMMFHMPQRKLEIFQYLWISHKLNTLLHSISWV